MHVLLGCRSKSIPRARARTYMALTWAYMALLVSVYTHGTHVSMHTREGAGYIGWG